MFPPDRRGRRISIARAKPAVEFELPFAPDDRAPNSAYFCIMRAEIRQSFLSPPKSYTVIAREGAHFRERTYASWRVGDSRVEEVGAPRYRCVVVGVGSALFCVISTTYLTL